MNKRIEELIERLGLIEHEEGGYFFRIFYSDNTVFSNRHKKERRALSSIYFLLTKDNSVSRFHKLQSDEIWHFYEGDMLRLHIVDEKGLEYRSLTIGSKTEEISYCAVVPANCWQAAETVGEYSLVGCSVAPAFEYDDFVMLQDIAYTKEKIITRFPELKRFV